MNLCKRGVEPYSPSFLAWAWLAKAKGHSYHTKNQLLPKPFTKRVKVRSTACHYATKKKNVKDNNAYLGLDNIIKLKFTINFDRCAISNVPNCLTKNFETVMRLFITRN